MLHIDFETRSLVNLKKSTVDVYADSPTTEALCMSWGFNEDSVEIWVQGEPLPAKVREHVEAGGEVKAHNAPFEWAVWNKIMTKRHGWPELRIEQLYCSMAQCYAMALPASLDAACAALGLSIRKDAEGHRLMLQMSKPRRVKNGVITWWEDDAKKARLYAYCKQDVEAERALSGHLRVLSAAERKLWLLDQKINQFGVHIDAPTVATAIETARKYRAKLDQKMCSVTLGIVGTCSQVKQLNEFAAMLGRPVPGLAKADIVELLKDNTLPPELRAALEIRQEAAKTSTAKLTAMLATIGEGNRARGLMQYHGASTGRWAGRKIQTQNMPRPSFGRKVIEAGLPHIGNIEYLEMIYGKPLEYISSALRSMICAPAGYDYIVGDFAAIESRVLAWLSGQKDKLDIFLGHGKVYEHNAATIFAVEFDEVTKDQRQIGKVAELALGYQGGVGAFIQMARNYGLDVAQALESLTANNSPERVDAAYRNYKEWRKTHLDANISDNAGLAAELIKLGWRDAAPKTVDYWKELEQAAAAAVRNPNTVYTAPKVKFVCRGSFLWCQLPSGRVLCYPYPRLAATKTPWGSEGVKLKYKTVNQTTRKWGDVGTYGGKLAENITQAVSRDLLAECLTRLDRKGYALSMHVHDEIVVEVPETAPESELGKVEDIMCELPVWAEGLPMAAECWRGKRYRK